MKRHGHPPAPGAALARALSKLGHCSRSEAWKLVEAGRVRVNGAVQRDPERRVSLAGDKITVDGQPLRTAARAYLMLNKPRGLITTTSDERGRETVFKCFEGADLPRVVPVGRLDQASEGLLLFTNDTAWADRITDPLTHLDKTYHVQIDRVADEPLARQLEAGTQVDGEQLAAKAAQLLRSGGKTSWLEIVLDEGKNRHIRRLLGAFGIEVMRLVRVAVGGLELGDLGKGEFRMLTGKEVAALGARRTSSGGPVRASVNTVHPASGHSQEVASRLRCHLKAPAEAAVRRGHPWVFAEGIATQNRAGQTGELAALFDRQDRFLAIGLYDDTSPLRVRVLHAGRPVNIDPAWWQARLEAALARRTKILDADTNACRLINGESDGFPGLVLDRYADVMALKLYTAAWLPRLEELTALLRESTAGQAAPVIVLRLSRNTQASFATAGYQDGQMIFGEKPGGPVIFRESGLRFEADVLQGQKTGFFLDQRENRRAVEELARGATVLNAFSFTGGFSLYAARGGAKSVASLDISAHALAGAQRNFALNQDEPAVARCRHEVVQANAFDWLKGDRTRQFDLIVLDPPSLAKREAERAGAIRAYENLAASAMSHLDRPGLLVAASCSAHVSAEEFFGAVQRAARAVRRKFTLLRTTRHAPDHAATFPEAEYLKAIYLRLG